MEAFGVDTLFTPECPVFSERGAVVTNIAHIPAALTAVMKLNGIAPDIRARGSLSLKPWIANDQGIALPGGVALPTVEAPAPYDMQIAALNQQVGAVIPRQNMKDKSGPRSWTPVPSDERARSFRARPRDAAAGGEFRFAAGARDRQRKRARHARCRRRGRNEPRRRHGADRSRSDTRGR
jgi:hypothetical protein